MNIATIWQRWHAYAARHTPTLEHALQGAVSDAELDSLQALGFALPDAFMDSLRIHNGQNPDADADFLAGGGRLLSAADILAHRDMLREALAGLQEQIDESDPAPVGIGPVRALTFCDRWLPIADCNGDVTWFLDFDPLPTGQPGQVIRVDLESNEWLVCAESYALFLDHYVRALEDGRIPVKQGQLQVKGAWPPIEQLPYLDAAVLDESRVLELGRAGRWDLAQKLAARVGMSEPLKLRITAHAEYQKGKHAKARKALEALRALGAEGDDDRWLLLDLLTKIPELQAELDAQIARAPTARLYARRAALYCEMATEPVRKRKGKRNPAEILQWLPDSENLEWLASPAGQQHHAVCMERAVADYRSARASEDRDEWRLAEGQCLLDMQRWEEAEALFAETVARMEATLAGEEPKAWSRSAADLEDARDGLRRAQTQNEGEDDAAREGFEGLLATLEEMGQPDGAAEVRQMFDTLERLRSQEAEGQAERDADPGWLDREARNIAEQIMKRHSNQPERLGVFPLELLDRKAAKFYDKKRDQLLALGFEHLADAEDLNYRERTGTRVMLRLMLAPDQLTVAVVWRLVGPGSVVDAVELESMLEDQSIMMTHNLGSSNPFDTPPLIARQSLPQDCPLPLLIEAHRNRLQHAHANAVPIHDLEGVTALQERQRVIKSDHAREQGWISEAELRGLLGASYRELAPAVRAWLRELDGA